MTFPAQRFVLSAGERPVVVQAAPELLVQMLDKLIANAVEFSPPGAPIELALRRFEPGREFFF